MESISENKVSIPSQERIDNSNQKCFSENFYGSFNNYKNSDISKDSQETIMPEDSNNKIMINLQNNEIPKKKIKIKRFLV